MGVEVGLDARTGALVELSAALARSDAEGWRSALEAAVAHAAGAEIEEALLQAHLFVGFPTVLDAFSGWREIAGTGTAGAVAAVDRPGAGEALCRAVYGGVYDRLRDHVRRLHPELDVWMVEHGYGRTLSRSGLSVETRELCIVGLLAAAGHERQLRAHLHGALNVGAPPGRVDAALRVGIRAAAGACRVGGWRGGRSREAARDLGGGRGSRGTRRGVERGGGILFVDVARIHVAGGAGGAGAVAFRREKGVPRGGPAGGRGGNGGGVILVADRRLDTLLDYSYRAHYKAGRAGHGEGKKRDGASGEDLRLPVPLGTLVRDVETGERIGELLEEGDELVVARGGRGGRGNASFASPTRQTPREWEPGEWGEERHIELELKLIADVGLVGEPNAGKSTLLARVTAAKPRIADYPFSTLTPNLGVVGLSGNRSFVIADIPGIIEGAHEGRGLGTQFLRHIERTRTLALLVPLDDEDPQATYDLLREELRAHNAALAGISHCVLLTKADLSPGAAEPPVSVDAPGSWGQFTISAVTGGGLDRALEGLWTRVQREKEAAAEEAEADPFGSSEAWRP